MSTQAVRCATVARRATRAPLAAADPRWTAQVPVGRIARERWRSVYTGLPELLRSMRAVDGWDEIEVTQWERLVDTDVDEWIAGNEDQDTWSIFSTLSADEIEATVDELRDDPGTSDRFDFLHAYDVAVFEKPAHGDGAMATSR